MYMIKCLNYESFAHQCLWLLDVFMPEQELAVQIAQINGIKINNMDFAKACENKVFEELTSDPSSAYH